MAQELIIGVDVGGTNTDAAVLCGTKVVTWKKVTTTEDVTSGVVQAISAVISDLPEKYSLNSIRHVSIGTTHFINAVIQRSNSLVPVAVIRLCGPASRALPPFIDFPDDLRVLMKGAAYMVNGGYQFDGRIIKEPNQDEIKTVAEDIKRNRITNVVISGVFSPSNPSQENQVEEWLQSFIPGISITRSQIVGYMGLLERENAAILNESLKPLSRITVSGFSNALQKIGLTCPFYLTQNDGTLISADDAMEMPVHTFACGATNSMRGAAFLCGIKDGLIIDIGGTSSDIGVLRKGFPKQASTKVQVGGVNTNFRMPDVVSIGLGGGSKIVQDKEGNIRVGPTSVGYRLSESKIFGGNTLTATDIAVKVGLIEELGNRELLQDLDDAMVMGAMKTIKEMIEKLIDGAKLSGEDQLVVLVGGGSIIVDTRGEKPLQGASTVTKPRYYEVANAVGAALSQVSGYVDTVISMADNTRDKALNDAKERAKALAMENGAIPETVQILEVDEVPITYMPGTAERVTVKAVGSLVMLENVFTGQLEDETAATASVQNVSSQNFPSASKTAKYSKEQETQGEILEFADSDHTEVTLDPLTGDWILSPYDIDSIATGAAILGCGGGGSPYLATLCAKKALSEGKEIRVIHPHRLGTTPELDGLVSAVAFMGAPFAIIEKLTCGTECTSAIKLIQDYIKHNPKEGYNEIVALQCDEIGGGNAIEPLIAAAELQLPVVDADTMGRAFPELQMATPFIYGLKICPAALVDEKGCKLLATDVESPKMLEDLFRACVVPMGCSAAVSLAPMTKEEVLERNILFTISKAWRLGDAVLRARKYHLSLKDIIMKHLGATLLMEGKVTDVDRKTKAGFSYAEIEIEGSDLYTGTKIKITTQNEHLIAKRVDKLSGNSTVIATTPDLISVLDSDSGDAITTEEVRYGLRVFVITMASHPLMCTEKALQFVSPKAFGFDDVEYNPCGTFVQCDCIPQILQSK